MILPTIILQNDGGQNHEERRSHRSEAQPSLESSAWPWHPKTRRLIMSIHFF
jgi:hypothetical protein